ncbi:hypothetical protein HDV05_004186 [Chytridiales sp. JEL 0842]|nr:hypothetical protein HDV05_004186 [Chytridiales sp. JEL 0842]
MQHPIYQQPGPPQPEKEPRTSLTHPINVSWLFPSNFLHPSVTPDDAIRPNVNAYNPSPTPYTNSHPLDLLDLLGIAPDHYPKGRAPSNSGFVGGFPVATVAKTRYTMSSSSSFSSTQNAASLVSSTTTTTTSASTSTLHFSRRSNTSLNATARPASAFTPTNGATLKTDSGSLSISGSFPLDSTSAPEMYEHVPGGNGGREAYELLEAGVLDSDVAVSGGPDSQMDDKNQGEEGLRILAMTATSSQSSSCTIMKSSTNGVESAEIVKTITESTHALEVGNGATSNPEKLLTGLRINVSDVPVLRGTHGNFALSSCPGKKVRLQSGPVNGRAMINRDLDHDFARLSALGIKAVVCCLNDAELSFLGAPLPKYLESAAKYNIRVLRIPIIEGSCPDTIAELEPILDGIEEVLESGGNVLCHCRGGVGRAGIRRSLKAIETARQEDYINAYQKYLESKGQ